MTPQEEKTLALGYARRIAALFNEVELSGEHGLVIDVDDDAGRVYVDGKYGRQAEVFDTFGHGWRVE